MRSNARSEVVDVMKGTAKKISLKSSASLRACCLMLIANGTLFVPAISEARAESILASTSWRLIGARTHDNSYVAKGDNVVLTFGSQGSAGVALPCNHGGTNNWSTFDETEVQGKFSFKRPMTTLMACGSKWSLVRDKVARWSYSSEQLRKSSADINWSQGEDIIIRGLGAAASFRLENNSDQLELIGSEWTLVFARCIHQIETAHPFIGRPDQACY